jgi:hypothetical protein
MEVGVPQGAVLSPTLFNMYIDDLVVLLQQFGEAFAFVDDIVISCHGTNNLELTIGIIDTWSTENRIQIDRDKSGILQIR